MYRHYATNPNGIHQVSAAAEMVKAPSIDIGCVLVDHQ